MRYDWSKQLRTGQDRNRWAIHTYDTHMSMSYSWNELIVPAGLLQFPFFDRGLPHFTMFGNMGSFVAHYVTHYIDQIGMHIQSVVPFCLILLLVVFCFKFFHSLRMFAGMVSQLGQILWYSSASYPI